MCVFIKTYAYDDEFCLLSSAVHIMIIYGHAPGAYFGAGHNLHQILREGLLPAVLTGGHFRSFFVGWREARAGAEAAR